MQIIVTPTAAAWLQSKGTHAFTVASLVFSSCCSGPLPPEVKDGAPSDTDGFTQIPTGEWTVYYDSLLEEQPILTIDLMDYVKYQELAVVDWPLA